MINIKKLADSLYKTIFFNIFFSILFILFRCIFIIYIGDFSFSFNDLVLAFMNAIRFDWQIIGALSVVVFIINFFISSKVFKVINDIFIVISSFLFVCNIGFYEIYNECFNSILLGLIFDDTKAILLTGFNGEFNLTIKFLLFLAISLISIYVFNFLINKLESKQNYNKYLTSGIFICFLFACLFQINGQIALSGTSLGRNLTPVENEFLRKITFGAYRDLGYVFKAYKMIKNAKLSDYTNESIQLVAQKFFNLDDNAIKKEINLKELLSHKVGKEANQHTDAKDLQPKIDHIFYIVAESFSTWHFSQFLESTNITKPLDNLAKNGMIRFEILQNAPRTIYSLSMQISGLFYNGIPYNLALNENHKSLAMAEIFNSLGYETRFYYGGAGTWQKLDSFSKAGGFKKLFHSGDIINFTKKENLKEPYAGIWGAYDYYLFDFIESNLKNDTKSKTPTFSMIMTTTYHPPFDAPMEQFNPPSKEIQDFINKENLAQSAKSVLEHAWLQMQNIASFIENASKINPNSLFIVVGDHSDNINALLKSMYYANTTPLLLYAPSIKNIKQIKNFANHLDLAPSIIELVAPNDFKYSSFGSPVWSARKQTTKNDNFILGYDTIATKRYIYNGFVLEYLDSAVKKDDDLDEAKQIYENLNRAKALSWWIYNHGFIIPPSE